MRRGRSALGRIFGTLVVALLAARGAGAQTFQPINSFTGCVAAGCSVGTDGARPASTLAAGPGGDFYGTTYGFPGSLGSVYRVSPSGARTTLVNFDEPQDPMVFGPSGAFPVGRLALGADGNLYGVTDGGGLNNGGVLFRVSSGGAFDVLHHFPTGFAPSGGPVFTADGDLFGVTANGGDANQGTVFKWDGSSVTTIYSFGTSAGAFPSGDLMLASDGHVYGAAPEEAASPFRRCSGSRRPRPSNPSTRSPRPKACRTAVCSKRPTDSSTAQRSAASIGSRRPAC